jgi:HEXXH motif-containing protein
MISVHALAWSDFDALASGLGDTSAIIALRGGQHSKHVLQLRALLDAAAEAGMRGVLEPGFALLSATQQSAPDVVTELLLHPPVGGWLAHCLRRLRGSGRDDSPVENDLGHLGAIAAAAALRANIDFVIQVPSRASAVMLPTLGAASIPGLAPGESVTIMGQAGMPTTMQGADRRVALPENLESAASGWKPLHRFRFGKVGQRLCVFLDDLDPFRDCHGSATTGSLDPGAVVRWQALLEEAWSLLTQAHPGYALGIGSGLRSIVPLHTLRPGHGTTATSSDSFGACVMSEPADAVALAVGLVHEFQHAKLGALMDLLPLHSADRAARYYAPWRDDPRPLGGLLHGTYAFLAVADFWRVQRTVTPPQEARFAHFEFARWREQTLHAVQTIQSSAALTNLGTRLVAAMEDRLRGWEVQVPPESAAAARDAIADHQVSWRSHNLRPAQERVRRIAEAWQAGQPSPTETATSPPEITSGGAALNENSRLDLLFLRLRDPDRFARVDVRRDELAVLIPAAEDADVAYVRGDLGTAAAGYRHMLRTQPDRLAGWIGLALVRKHLIGDRADPLVDEPELVVAVSQQIARLGCVIPDPCELADWLASGVQSPVTGTAVQCRTARGAGS